MEDANIETIINIILLLPLVIYGWYLILKDDKVEKDHKENSY